MNLREKKQRKQLFYIGVILLMVLFAGYLSWYARSQSMSVHYVNLEEQMEMVSSDGRKTTVSPPISLEKGNYVFALYYSCTEGDNRYEIYSPTTMEEDGTLGKLYGSMNLDPAGNRAAFELSFDSDVWNLEIRIAQGEGELEITEIAYRNEKKYNDPIIFYVLAVTAAAVCVFLHYHGKRKGTDLWDKDAAGYLMLFIFISMLPFLNDFLIDGHDTEFHLDRIEGTYRSLKAGQFPVRIKAYKTNGYGYASPVMYPQLLIYIPALFRMMGMSLLNSFKILVLLTNALTAFISYFSFKKLFGTKYAGIIGASFYMLSVYRLTNLFLRAAMGEVLAMAFLPLIFYGIYEIIFRDHKKWIWAALGITGMFQSHILTTEIILVILVLVCIFSIVRFVKEPVRILSMSLAAAVTVLLNLWTIIPLLDYFREPFYILQDQPFYLMDRSVYLSQIFATFVSGGKNLSTLGSTQGEMPLTLGLGLVLGVLLYVWLISRKKQWMRKDPQMESWYHLGNVSLIISGILVLMSCWFFPWNFFMQNPLADKMVRSLQYLWRLFSPASMLLCITAAAAFCFLIKTNEKHKDKIILAACVISLLCCAYSIDGAMQYDTYQNKEEVADILNIDILYLYPEDDYNLPAIRGNAVTASQDSDITVRNFIKNGTNISFNIVGINDASETYLEVPLYYYPGYHGKLNGEPLTAVRGDNGVVRILFPEGTQEGEVEVFFQEKTLWKLGNLITLLTILCLSLYYFFGKNIRTKLKKT